jgi:hypothetical protein
MERHGWFSVEQARGSELIAVYEDSTGREHFVTEATTVNETSSKFADIRYLGIVGKWKRTATPAEFNGLVAKTDTDTFVPGREKVTYRSI